MFRRILACLLVLQILIPIFYSRVVDTGKPGHPVVLGEAFLKSISSLPNVQFKYEYLFWVGYSVDTNKQVIFHTVNSHRILVF